MTQSERPAFICDLPTFPTMGVGSYAAPGWFIKMLRELRAGNLGPVDAHELLLDATRVVVDDQLDTGLDIVSDGELRRQRFVYEMYQHIEGLEREPPARRLGITGYDMTPSFRALGPLHTPTGFGLVEEFTILKQLCAGRPTKMALPGPLTFLGSIDPGDLGREALIEDALRLVSTELEAVVAAGATFIQIDEPRLAHPPLGLDLQDAVALINRVIARIDAYVAVHVCFGNNAGRPFADRRLSRLTDALLGLECDQLSLEMANREMAEIEVLAPLGERFDIAAGLIDVKNFYLEPPERVAERITACLTQVARERLWVSADCGFSALPRYIARQKMQNLVDGARLARGER